MIDLTNEQVLSLAQAAKHPALPRRRAGKRVHIATLHRWATRGCRGIQLETIRFGGTRCTSLEAVQRFCERLSDADPCVSAQISVTPARRRREIARAEKELEQAGIK